MSKRVRDTEIVDGTSPDLLRSLKRMRFGEVRHIHGSAGELHAWVKRLTGAGGMYLIWAAGGAAEAEGLRVGVVEAADAIHYLVEHDRLPRKGKLS